MSDCWASPAIAVDMEKCIGCGLCVRACNGPSSGRCGALALSPPVRRLTLSRGGGGSCNGSNGSAHRSLAGSGCVECGACAVSCPTGAIAPRNSISSVEDALVASESHGQSPSSSSASPVSRGVILQVAPGSAAAIGECFNATTASPPSVESQLWRILAAAKLAGFAHVVGTSVGADVYLLKAAKDLLGRLTATATTQRHFTPVLSACCPAWSAMVRSSFPDMAHMLSAVPSPMLSVNSWALSHIGGGFRHVAVMPCVAKKGEAARTKGIDDVLTTTELATLFRRRGIDDSVWSSFRKPTADSPATLQSVGVTLGSGAAQLFGCSGGITEAIVRTMAALRKRKAGLTNGADSFRGTDGIRETTVDIGDGLKFRAVMVHGGANAKKFLEDLRSGATKPPHFAEVMMCSGGCVGGLGQPKANTLVRAPTGTVNSVIEARKRTLYELDSLHSVRVPHTASKFIPSDD